MSPRRTTSKFGEPLRGQARARAIAARLGTIADESLTLDREKEALAWAFDVRRPEDPGRVVIVAGALSCASTVLLWLEAARAPTGLLLGKAIAASSTGTLLVGAVVVPDPEQYGGQVDLAAIPGAFRIAPASTLELFGRERPPSLASGEAVLAVPEGSPASIQGPLAKLLKSLRKLKRLQEVHAPVLIVQNEQELVRTLVSRLKAAGWNREVDPLPEELQPLAARALGNAWDL